MDHTARIEGIAPKESDKRKETLVRASELGADDATLVVLRDAIRVSRTSTMTLPARYGNTSRAKGWARLGSGDTARWGVEYRGDYEVAAPGKWVVFSSDGFKREEKVNWTVEHVSVGPETWTVAS